MDDRNFIHYNLKNIFLIIFITYFNESCIKFEVGVIFNDETGKDQKRYVEITMVFHTLKGLSQMKMRGEEPPLNMGMLPEYQKRISICNYRFIREFTKGVDGEWTINLLNHFKPSDHLDE